MGDGIPISRPYLFGSERDKPFYHRIKRGGEVKSTQNNVFFDSDLPMDGTCCECGRPCNDHDLVGDLYWCNSCVEKALEADASARQLDIEAGHNQQHAPSWKHMAALYAFYFALICGTAWVIVHWSPSIEVLCAVLVFALVVCFIIHRNTGGCA